MPDPVRKFGIAYKPEGVNLREKPSPTARVLKHLPFNTRVFVASQENGWLLVTTDDGRFGYCVATHITTNLPEPNAKIHWIEHGQSALKISQKYYGGKAEWGSDHRFYVSGLVYANQGAGRRGIFKPNPNADWSMTQVLTGTMIWVPSLEFLKSLRGKIPSGSISHAAWEAAKTAIQAAADFTLGVAGFIGGVIHGALESLWDVLVGLKDLAVMIWDIVSSLLTGNLLSDASRLWSDVSKLDWKALVKGWIDRFEAKWNAPDLLSRWHFRGWVIGYAVMEVLMLFFSGGVVQGIKWAGKAAKVSKVLASLPRLQKLSSAVKTSKSFQKVATLLGKGAPIAETVADAKKWINQLLVKPKSLWGKSPEQIADVFRKAGYEVAIEQSTKGSKLSKQIRIKRFDINNIQVHPGGGLHGGSYYKISSSTKKKIKLVDRATYIVDPLENATLIFMDTGLQGWMLQAAAANAAAQNTVEELRTASGRGGR